MTNTFYSVITVWADDHTDTRDFPSVDAAMKEWDWRKKSLSDFVLDIRIIRVSSHRILDITPGQENPDEDSTN